MSLQPAKVSGKISGDILEEVYERADDDTIDKELFDKDLYVRANQGRIRRIAHIVVFVVLGMLAALASFYTFGMKIIGFVLPVFITVSYSFIDELIQLTAPGRSFEWEDLGRDLLGSAAGVVIIYLIIGVIIRIRKK